MPHLPSTDGPPTTPCPLPLLAATRLSESGSEEECIAQISLPYCSQELSKAAAHLPSKGGASQGNKSTPEGQLRGQQATRGAVPAAGESCLRPVRSLTPPALCRHMLHIILTFTTRCAGNQVPDQQKVQVSLWEREPCSSGMPGHHAQPSAQQQSRGPRWGSSRSHQPGTRTAAEEAKGLNAYLDSLHRAIHFHQGEEHFHFQRLVSVQARLQATRTRPLSHQTKPVLQTHMGLIQFYSEAVAFHHHWAMAAILNYNSLLPAYRQLRAMASHQQPSHQQGTRRVNDGAAGGGGAASREAGGEQLLSGRDLARALHECKEVETYLLRSAAL